MWTAEWWWEIQQLLLKGATLAPIIISSDKTQLTRFSGDKQAWPVFSKTKRSVVAHQLFHDCMLVMQEPLKAAGNDGVRMDCADDGFVRMMFPILSAYIADYPEHNSCHRSLVPPKKRGEPINSRS
ncbi:hypothetical protein B0H10DRAFT_2179186 [Mycena sp. CBHHK59/15]|nr:hypothetical protein B0H10DRAFT_2179186 [Mycena sp. CBHHK59/15]